MMDMTRDKLWAYIYTSLMYLISDQSVRQVPLARPSTVAPEGTDIFITIFYDIYNN